MKYSIYLTDNSREILDTLKDKGYYICPCCRFENVKWIHLYIRKNQDGTTTKEFHGTGGGCEMECEGMSSEKCIACSVLECSEKRNILILHDIESFENFLNFIENNDGK